jgi:hypothetical protein
VAAGVFELKSVLIPAAELSLSWDFFSGKSYFIGASAIAEYISSVTKDEILYKAAVEPMAALYWTSKFGHDKVNTRVALTLKNSHQQTSVSEQKEQAAILGVMIYLPL